MGLITGALQIGRSALLAYQSALQAVGNNVSNAGVAGYTRQTPVLMPSTGVLLPEGLMPGGGVTLNALRRNVDESLENRIRYAMGDQSGALAEQQTLSRIESVINELSDGDLSTLMQTFFNAFSGLQNQPTSQTARALVISTGDSLASEIRRQRTDTLSLVDELNRDVVDATARAATIAGDIAELNVRITGLEASNGGSAGALRDQRDLLLRELGELVQIEVREQPGGQVNVYVGNEPLIQNGLNRGLTTTLEIVDGTPRQTVRFADNNSQMTLSGGKIAGLVGARDTHVMGYVNALDGLARALINEVNKVHAAGQGLEGFTSLTGGYEVLDTNAVLNSAQAGLDQAPRNGSFLLRITDSDTGAFTETVITVDLDGVGTDDTLQTIADQINAKVSDVTASITADNRLQLVAGTGFSFTFGDDTSNLLASVGMNTFFAGTNAQDLQVSDLLRSNVNLLAAATTNSPGDGSNAARLASLATDSLPGLNGMSLSEYYNTLASDVAVRGSAALQAVRAADTISLSLTAQRESISGVSLDEETISLLRLERSFQGAARYASTVDRLIQEMLSLVG